MKDMLIDLIKIKRAKQYRPFETNGLSVCHRSLSMIARSMRMVWLLLFMTLFAHAGGEAGGGGCLGQTNFASMWGSLIRQLYFDSQQLSPNAYSQSLPQAFKTNGDVLREALKGDHIQCTGKLILENGLQALTTPFKEVLLADKAFEDPDRPGICHLVLKEMYRYLGGDHFNAALDRTTQLGELNCTDGIERAPGSGTKRTIGENTYFVRVTRNTADEVQLRFCAQSYYQDRASCRTYATLALGDLEDYFMDLEKGVDMAPVHFNALAKVGTDPARKQRALKNALLIVGGLLPAWIYVGRVLSPTLAKYLAELTVMGGAIWFIYDMVSSSIDKERHYLTTAILWLRRNVIDDNLAPGSYIDLRMDLGHYNEMQAMAEKMAMSLGLVISGRTLEVKAAESFSGKVND